MSLTNAWTRLGCVLLVVGMGSGCLAAQDLQKENAALKKEAAALRAERAVMQQQLKEHREIIKKLSTQLKESQTKQMQLKASLEVMQKRTEFLLKELRELVEKKPRKPIRVNPAKDGANPPTKDLEGKILQVSAKGTLVQVNLGSDNGLKKGHTLDVVRLGDAPRYLSMIRIVEVSPMRAVAEQVTTGPLASTQTLQVGDTVVSSILSPN